MCGTITPYNLFSHQSGLSADQRRTMESLTNPHLLLYSPPNQLPVIIKEGGRSSISSPSTQVSLSI